MKTCYWSREVDKFVNINTGERFQFSRLVGGPTFKGTVHEWYETLVETMITVRAEAVKAGLVLSDEKLKVFVSPDVKCILEASVLYDYATDTLASFFSIVTRESPRDEILISGAGKVIVLDLPLLK